MNPKECSNAPILEYTQAGSSVKLDREQGILHEVKILGLVSLNARTYAPEALKQAKNLYENAKVNVNHPKGRPESPRDYQDRLGNIQNVEFRESDGLYADFYFNPHHPLAEQLMWDAEHAPGNVGFSHNILARTSKNADGTLLVEEITSVRSVDLVADPATTNGLFESQNTASEAHGSTSEACGSTSEMQGPASEALQEELTAVRQSLAGLQRQFQAFLRGSHTVSEPVSRIPSGRLAEHPMTTEEFVRNICR